MKKLWQKDYKLNQAIETFETKGDLLLDQELVKSDVIGSLAHAMGLKKIGILTEEELSLLKRGLKEISELNNSGKFALQFGEEDVHTKIENYLTDLYGKVGKKIHTGRSRNDQVLTAIRLFTKDQIILIWEQLLGLIEALIIFSKQHENEILVGYTHMQKAMPSTVGMWSSALVEGLLNSIILLKSAYQINDQSPLGSAAGYGIPLKIDREYTTKLLGFKNVQINSLYCQNSRGKVEGVILAALISILQDVNKFATDVLLFTTSEFGFFEIDKQLCSGSSIMPQKKNVDIAELLRSKVHILLGNYCQIISLSSNLVSGYNRDLQDSKKPLFESLEMTHDSLKVATILVKGISINQEKIKKSMTPEVFATHYALSLVRQGMAFREAYQKTGGNISMVKYDPAKAIKESKHLGGTGNLGLKLLTRLYQKEVSFFKTEKHKFIFNQNLLLKGGENHEKSY